MSSMGIVSEGMGNENHDQIIKGVILAGGREDGISDKPFLQTLIPNFTKGFRSDVKDILDLDIGFDIKTIDMSSHRRLKCKNLKELTNFYQEILVEVIKYDGNCLKLPTTTMEEKDVMAYYNKLSDEEKAEIDLKEYLDIHTKSPNAIMRKMFGFMTLFRDFFGALPWAPGLPENIHFASPDIKINDLYVEEDGIIYREMSYAAIDKMLENITPEYLNEKGIESVSFISKHTVSKFDEEVFKYVSYKLGLKGIKVEKELYDSFLGTITRGKGDEMKRSNALFLMSPDHRAMLKGFENVTSDQIVENKFSENIDKKRDNIHRVGWKSGYSEDMKKTKTGIRETYTLDEEAIIATAKSAFEDAEKTGQTVILVAMNDEENFIDKKMYEIVSKKWGGKFVIQSISSAMEELLINPHNTKKVWLTLNNLGDFLSDYLLPLYFGILRMACFGSGNEVTKGDNCNQYATSTGTAPKIKSINQINPSGQIIALCNAILGSRGLPAIMIPYIENLKKTAISILVDYGDGNFEGYIEHLFKTARESFGNDNSESEEKIQEAA